MKRQNKNLEMLKHLQLAVQLTMPLNQLLSLPQTVMVGSLIRSRMQEARPIMYHVVEAVEEASIENIEAEENTEVVVEVGAATTITQTLEAEAEDSKLISKEILMLSATILHPISSLEEIDAEVGEAMVAEVDKGIGIITTGMIEEEVAVDINNHLTEVVEDIIAEGEAIREVTSLEIIREEIPNKLGEIESLEVRSVES